MTDAEQAEKMRAVLVRIRDIAAAGHLLANRVSIIAAIDQCLAPPPPVPDGPPELTQKQAAVLDFIRSGIATNGYPPSVREIGVRFGITGNAVVGHLAALKKKGYLRWDPTKSRTLSVVGVGS
jgi:DNA-binding CsgD family transcriptional regulator